MSHRCIFCNHVITPEESIIEDGQSKDPRSGYVFHCENNECQAIYDSIGQKVPEIIIRERPIERKELNFEEEL